MNFTIGTAFPNLIYLVMSSWLTARGVPGGTAAKILVDACREDELSKP